METQQVKSSSKMHFLTCPVCAIVSTNIYYLTKHFRYAHAFINEKSQKIFLSCKIDNCQSVLKGFKSFISHVRREHLKNYHKNRIHAVPHENNDAILNVNDIPNPITVENNGLQAMNLDNDDNFFHDEDDFVDVNENMSYHVNKMIAHLRVFTNTTGRNVANVMNITETMLINVLKFLKAKLKNFLEEYNFDMKDEKVQELMQVYSYTEEFQRNLSLDKQIKILKKNFQYIEPQEIFLDSHIGQVAIPNTVDSAPKPVKHSFQYIPIIETMKLLLSHSSVFDYVNNNVRQPTYNGDLNNFEDGDTFKNHEFFQKYPNSLRILLFIDDLGIVNPLGSKTKPNKLGAVYFIIQNIPEFLQSYFGGIHTLILYKVEDFKVHGFQPIMQPFLNDLKKLESDEGVEVIIKGLKYVLRASIAAVTADTLAAHELFGLLGPKANYFCRLCMIPRKKFNEETFKVYQKRTKQLHDEHLQSVSTNVAQQKKTGVKTDCILHESKYFHFTRNFVFDIMHDFLEGICPQILKYVINHYVYESGCINLLELNNRILSFKYGPPDSKNKPSATLTEQSIQSSDNKLKQRAAQMWTLMRIFPFLISDKIQDDDTGHLEYLLSVNIIMEFAFSPKLNTSVLPYLSDLCIDLEKEFKRLFPDKNPINKLPHISAHLAECIEKSGPLRLLWCMRFEGYHNLFKRYASICCNFKNIPKTMARISQIKQCAIWGTGEEMFREKLLCNSGNCGNVENTPCKADFLSVGFEELDDVFTTSKITVHGSEYRAGLFVAIDKNRNVDLPVFGKIHEIYVIRDNVYFYCNLWPTESYNLLLNGYLISKSNEFRLVDQRNLLDHKCFVTWFDYKEKKPHIVLRHFLL